MRAKCAVVVKKESKPVRPALLVAPFDAKQARAAQEAWAKHLGIAAEVTNSLGMKFRVIPPGTFDMGSSKEQSEGLLIWKKILEAGERGRTSNEAIHRVTITQPKLLGVYTVTQGEWSKLMGSNPSYFQAAAGENTNRFPVEQVSWEDCQKFLKRLNSQHGLKGWRYRLPTEAEWEYACRAGTVTPFWFGSELNASQANCDGTNPYQSGKGPYLQSPSVVGDYDMNPFGLHDQHGNVWEWCQDWYGTYGGPAEDPNGASSGSSRVLRGGSWFNNATSCRSASRHKLEASFRCRFIGFRLLCELF